MSQFPVSSTISIGNSGCQAGGREFKSRQSRTKPRREMGFFVSP